MAEIPEVHIQIVPSGRDPVGVGDRAGVGVAPAVASAFFAATGRRLRQTPFLPERVLAALRA
jgi:CO/xanthine dehydrogenase Mo-binding subunit